MSMLRACLVMLPRLAASERLAAALTTAVGTGAMKEDDRKDLQAEWIREARPPLPRPHRPAGPPRSIEEVAAAARAAGIKIVLRPPKGAPARG